VASIGILNLILKHIPYHPITSHIPRLCCTVLFANDALSVTTATTLSCYLLFCYCPIAFIVVDDAEADDDSGADSLGSELGLGLG